MTRTTTTGQIKAMMLTKAERGAAVSICCIRSCGVAAASAVACRLQPSSRGGDRQKRWWGSTMATVFKESVICQQAGEWSQSWLTHSVDEAFRLVAQRASLQESLWPRNQLDRSHKLNMDSLFSCSRDTRLLTPDLDFNY